MTGQQLIDAIQMHNLEDLDIFYIGVRLSSGITIEFENDDLEFSYPNHTDASFYQPGQINKYKVLEVDDKGNICYDKALVRYD